MKFSVYLKDPDGFSDAIMEAVNADVVKLKLSEAEADAVSELRTEAVNTALEPWVTYGECVSIEFDTDAGTATVLKVRQ